VANEIFFTINNFSYSPSYLEKTRKTWEPPFQREFANEECIELANNFIDLELLLREVALSVEQNAEECTEITNKEVLPKKSRKRWKVVKSDEKAS